MTKTREEKKKAEKLTLKNMKKRHWAGVVIVGSILGIMLGNIGGDEPTPKAEAKVEAKVETEAQPLKIGEDAYIIAEIKYNGLKDGWTEKPEVLYLKNLDKSGIDVKIEFSQIVDGQAQHLNSQTVALAKDRLLPVTLEHLKPGKYTLQLKTSRHGQNLAKVPYIGDFQTAEFEIK